MLVAAQEAGVATPDRCPERVVRPNRADGGHSLLSEKGARRIDEPIGDHRTATLCDGALAGALLHGDFAGVKDFLL
jgi:hypothetical protein